MSSKEKANLEDDALQAPLLSQVKPTGSRKQSDPMIIFWAYWPLLIHFVSVLIFGLVLIFVVNGAKFNIVSRIESVQETDGSKLPLPLSPPVRYNDHYLYIPSCHPVDGWGLDDARYLALRLHRA
jgi:hypothetical protein